MKKMILLLALALLAVACGSAANAGDGIATGDEVASLTGFEAVQDEEAATEEADTEEAFLAFTQCMRDNGIDMEDPTVDGSGNVRPSRPQNFQELDREELDAAFEACQQHLEGVTLGFRGDDRTEIEDTLYQYAACMRDNGYDMQDPDFTGFGPGQGGAENEDGAPVRISPFGQIDPGDSAFIAANEVCDELLSGFQRGPGPGGGPGGQEG